MTNLEDKLSASIKTESKDTIAPASTPAKPAARSAAPETTKPASTGAKPATRTAAKKPVARATTTKPAVSKSSKPSADDIQVPAHDTSTHPRRVWPD